jgi:hypothetical protein
MKSFVILLLGFSILSAVPSYGQKDPKKKSPSLTEEELYKLHVEAKVKPPTGPSFYIAPIAETPGRYSMAFKSAEGQHVSGMYVLRQLEIDVSKMGNQSQFFITVNSTNRVVTIDAGLIKRGDPKAKAFLFDILRRVQEAKNASLHSR